jgi:large subunit ribosomal protein L21
MSEALQGRDFLVYSCGIILFLKAVRIDLQMKKAVIQTGGKQYIVHEGETLKVELVKEAAKQGRQTVAVGSKVDFEPLLTIDGDDVQVGTPGLAKVKVTAEILESDVQADKVTSIRYKAKKRVHTVRGHRQHQTILKINKIA